MGVVGRRDFMYSAPWRESDESPFLPEQSENVYENKGSL
jgi:hypothetical protein